MVLGAILFTDLILGMILCFFSIFSGGMVLSCFLSYLFSASLSPSNKEPLDFRGVSASSSYEKQNLNTLEIGIEGKLFCRSFFSTPPCIPGY